MNKEPTPEIATVQVGEDKIIAFERVERLIATRCNQILEITGKGNFDHPLMAGFFELQSLNDKIIGLKNIQHEKNEMLKRGKL